MAEDFAMEIRKTIAFHMLFAAWFRLSPITFLYIFCYQYSTLSLHNLSHTYIDINGGHYKRGNGTSPWNVDACRMGTTSCLFNLVSS